MSIELDSVNSNLLNSVDFGLSIMISNYDFDLLIQYRTRIYQIWVANSNIELRLRLQLVYDFNSWLWFWLTIQILTVTQLIMVDFDWQ